MGCLTLGTRVAVVVLIAEADALATAAAFAAANAAAAPAAAAAAAEVAGVVVAAAAEAACVVVPLASGVEGLSTLRFAADELTGNCSYVRRNKHTCFRCFRYLLSNCAQRAIHNRSLLVLLFQFFICLNFAQRIVLTRNTSYEGSLVLSRDRERVCVLPAVDSISHA